MKCKIGEPDFMPPKFCSRDLDEVISDYIDHCLDSVMCRRIERHIAKFSRCRICIQTLQKTVRIIKAQGAAKVPAAVQVTLRRKLISCAHKTQKKTRRK